MVDVNFEDDPGAPSEDAYTANEKRWRAKSRWWLLIGALLYALMLLGILLY